MIQIQNEKLLVEISTLGAEVKRVYHLGHEIDYLWDSNPSFWAKSSPILFPIVGRLAKNQYLYDGKSYSLSQHGFARDLEFELVEQGSDTVWFELKANDVTREMYPFDFVLRIGYILEDETLAVKWQVLNHNEEVMPFSIGAHPAFSTKLASDDEYSDYYLHFETNEGISTYLFDNETGRVYEEKEQIIDKLKLLPLSKELFEEYPTLIIENEAAITLRCYNHEREVVVRFDGFPYVGIWSPINALGEIADFVCIEPWYGVADTVGEPQELMSKKGIQVIEPHSMFEASYSMTFK
ncbi:aldose 1-epimerase family protein [Turicibacter sanguinis]|uniref:aldose 1-epimerase family protein n=1 Tax=Turicibacter sanguinis TaxID=154288 RepID=UPI0018A99634|nr:aldose 1-epimerase family protein [Turicibacter sanguinis]